MGQIRNRFLNENILLKNEMPALMPGYQNRLSKWRFYSDLKMLPKKYSLTGKVKCRPKMVKTIDRQAY
jgi:hypothetical protein